MISHHHKTIFVHIPKCGGQSVENAFLADIGLTWETRAPLLLRANDIPALGPPMLAHLTAQDYLRYHYVTQEQMDGYFKFSIVRNPFARVISLYNYMRFSGELDLFVGNWLQRQFGLADGYRQDQHDYKGKYHFVRPQIEFVGDAEGKILVDEILPLEEIGGPGFDTIRKRSGLTSDLPHVNSSYRKSAKVSDLSDEAAETIRTLYAADFSAFGYAQDLPG